MMRSSIAGVFLGLFVSTPTHAIGNLTALLNVQEECAQVGEISFGEHQRWAECAVTRGRWMATIDIIDMYQAQYCLGSGQDGICDKRALMVFGNRAYTPLANLLLQRIDPGDTEYDDPLVVKNDAGRFLTISARFHDGTKNSRYYVWQAGQWVPIDSQAWLIDLKKQLPAGITAKNDSVFDVDTLSSKANLYRKRDPEGSPSIGVAQVELRLSKNRFSVKKIRIEKIAK